MNKLVEIEYQDGRGSWKWFSSVPNLTLSIEQGLQAAKDHPAAVDSRALEGGTRRVIDLTTEVWADDEVPVNASDN